MSFALRTPEDVLPPRKEFVYGAVLASAFWARGKGEEGRGSGTRESGQREAGRRKRQAGKPQRSGPPAYRLPFRRPSFPVPRPSSPVPERHRAP